MKLHLKELLIATAASATLAGGIALHWPKVVTMKNLTPYHLRVQMIVPLALEQAVLARLLLIIRAMHEIGSCRHLHQNEDTCNGGRHHRDRWN
jgi:hypothetical protein